MGIEPISFQLIRWRLNQLHYRVPTPKYVGQKIIYIKLVYSILYSVDRT
jgi:hypothetical protein